MSYVARPIVKHWGVFDGDKLCLVCNRKLNAELIVKILEVDSGEDDEHNYDGFARDYGSDDITLEEWIAMK